MPDGLKKRGGLGPPRGADPSETLERIRPLFAEAGITRLAHVTYLDKHDIPVTLSIRPNAKSMTCSSGKGLTLEAALVSGAMEGLELYAAEDPSIPWFSATYEELDCARVPTERLPFRAESRFHPARRERWHMAWDLMNREMVAIPFETVFMDLCFELVRETTATFRTDSNGLASGNHPAEALASALYEVVERDAVTCWDSVIEELGRNPPRVDLSNAPSARLENLVERILSAGLNPYLFDVSVDTDVPTYEAFICDRESPRQVSGGYGAHLDPCVAMERALIEAVQGRTVVIAGARDDIYELYYDIRRLEGADRFLDWAESIPATAEMREDQSTDSFEGDVQVVLEKLQKAGLHQAMAVNLTPDGWPITVVRVCVPGLEGYHRRRPYAGYQ